ncbi:MAG: DUF3021 domain-containing protein [Spirochaetales bacterium]|nr:DUF3021 domain-containing protein [Spirochaetales bacterium]
MKERLVGKLALGFIIGAVVGDIIVFVINIISRNGCLFAAPKLVNSVGPDAAVLLQTFLSGVHGLVCFGGTEFFRIERWSLFRATLTHFLCVITSYFIIGTILGWIGFDITSVITLAIIVIVYFIIWIIMGKVLKKDVTQMNSNLEKYKEENSK